MRTVSMCCRRGGNLSRHISAGQEARVAAMTLVLLQQHPGAHTARVNICIQLRAQAYWHTYFLSNSILAKTLLKSFILLANCSLSYK